MSCTYIDICPLTPGDRYIQPRNVHLLYKEQSLCLPSSYFISKTLFCSIKDVGLQGELNAPLSHAEEPSLRQHVVVQQRYVENLRRQIQIEQRQAESELETEQAHLQQQHSEGEWSFHLGWMLKGQSCR